MRRLLIAPMGALLLGTPTLIVPLPLPLLAQEAKSPTIARIIGIVPGAGHMYAGETGRGFAYLGGTLGVLGAGTLLLAANCVWDVVAQEEDCDPGLETAVTVAALGFYGWTIYDAGRAAHRTNASRGLKTSLLLKPARLPVSASRDGWGMKLGMSVATR